MRWPVALVLAAAVAGSVVGLEDAAARVPGLSKGATPQAATAALGITSMPVLEEEVLAVINEFRQAHGLVPLRRNPDLAATARQHSLSMAANGYFQHSSPSGSPFWKRVQWRYSRRAARWSVGENLVWASPDLSAREALELWLSSEPHRKNLLQPAWREIGLGAVHSPSAPGVYGGLNATILTADFGVRR